MRRSNKLLVGLLLVFVLVGCLGAVLPVHGLITVYTYNNNYQPTNLNTTHGSSNASVSGIAVTFKAGASAYLTSANFVLYRPNSMDSGCTLTAYLTGTTGTILAQNALPDDATIYDSSNVVAVSSVSNVGFNWFAFTFHGNKSLSAGSNYTIVVLGGGTNWNNAGDVGITTNGFITTGSTDSVGSQGARYHNGGWDNETTGGFSFTFALQVYGEASASGTPVPTYPGGDPSVDGGLLGGSMIWYILALILLLVPPFILGVFMRGGKWGFLIGLAIGAGLAYVVVPSVMPIWLVVLIAVGLGAAFLTSVRGGG